MPRFLQRSEIAAPAAELFAWHDRPGAFERLLPPWSSTRLVELAGGLQDDARVVLRVGMGPIERRWVARLHDCEPGRGFVDEQLEGPFAHWVHEHRFVPADSGGCVLEDEIDYRLPWGPVGSLAGGAYVRRELSRMFRFRHRRTAADLERHLSVPRERPLCFAVTGASGLVGSDLVHFLRSGGHRVLRLVRRKPRREQDEVCWDPDRGRIDASALEGADVLVHLAGANIAASRWTPERKRVLIDSRVNGTGLVAQAAARMQRRPQVLVVASAIGFYGNRGSDALDEDSEHGAGFLADICRAWEAAAEPAAKAGIRVVHLRIGVVLSARGGALGRMLTPFRLGAGGVVGSGRQFLSWIALDDLVGVIHFVAHRPELSGPVNAVSPAPVTQQAFTKALGRVLRRPTILPLPSAAVRLAFGEMGEELLLGGARVIPAKLEKAGFTFLHPELEAALAVELGRG